MVRVSIDIVFFKNELLRMSVSVLRTIELEALQIFKAVVDFGGKRVAAVLSRVPMRSFPRGLPVRKANSASEESRSSCSAPLL
jgi:phospholipid N-methyltransferase